MTALEQNTAYTTIAFDGGTTPPYIWLLSSRKEITATKPVSHVPDSAPRKIFVPCHMKKKKNLNIARKIFRERNVTGVTNTKRNQVKTTYISLSTIRDRNTSLSLPPTDEAGRPVATDANDGVPVLLFEGVSRAGVEDEPSGCFPFSCETWRT